MNDNNNHNNNYDISLVESNQSNQRRSNNRLMLSSTDPSPYVSSNSSDSSLSTSPSMVRSDSDQQIIESVDQFERNSVLRSDSVTNHLNTVMKSERNRLKSYFIRDNTKWANPNVRPEDLANAGFFYINDDKVQCAFCSGQIRNWSRGDRPLAEHARHFTTCPFIMEEDVGNIPIHTDPILGPQSVLGHDVCGNRSPNEQYTHQTNHSEPNDMRSLGIEPYSGPKNPVMGPLEARKLSFTNNGWDNSVPVSVDNLAEAGFYYIGIDDKVKCFHCDGGLGEWVSGDDPWVEHAKNFSHCVFLKLNKTESFIENCKRLTHNGSQSQTEDNSSDDITICRIVDNWMNSEVVRQLIGINRFSIDLIKATLNNRYHFNKTNYQSFAELYEDVSEADNRLKGNQSIANVISPAQSNSGENDFTNKTMNPELSVRPEDQTENPLICKICYLQDIGVVFLPCGHQLACNGCAQRLTNCPICRHSIRGYVKTYFS